MIKSHKARMLTLISLIGLSVSLGAHGIAPTSYTGSLWQSIATHPHKKLIATLAAAGVASWYIASKVYAPLKWNWASLEAQGQLDVPKLTFSRNFLWGVGTSAQQVEGGCTNNSWFAWEQERDAQGNLVHVEEVAGNACNQWDEKQLDHDIKLMQELGINAYRFSVEWSKIEPQEGVIDQDAVAHYVTICKKLRAYGIRPVITLHHYTDPLWFMARGGFAKAENIKYYVNFCVTMFNALNQYKPLWLTFNSPASYAINSYYRGTRPPAKKSMQTAVEVLGNLLQAHVQAYHAMKAQADGSNSEIGILHNILHLDIWHYWNPLDYLARYLGNKLAHTCIYDFFTTGTFSVNIPGKASYTADCNPHACNSLDFIGLNYYSHNYMRFFKPMPAPYEIPTANPQYTIYAEGLYRAIAELAEHVTKPLEQKLGKEIPIYVTENGIGTDDNTTRATFFKRTLYALSQAHQRYNVKGYIHWSFMDNYEWGTYSKRYGVYAVDFATQQRTFKPGAQHFKDVLHAWARPPYASVAGDWARSTLASLTLREKIGQLFVVATTSCFEQQEEALAASLFRCPYKMNSDYINQLITDYHIGGLIFLYKSTPELQIAATNAYQARSRVPLLIAQDCEWGLSMRLYNTLEFPKNNLLGKIANKQLIYAMGNEVGRQCKALGVHLNCAPVVDVCNNPNNKLLQKRSFGGDPDLVAHAGLLMMQGLQDAGIIACAKHFPGHGDTVVDSHTNLPCIAHTREHLDQIELLPFKHLIEHGVGAVMLAHLAIPALEPEVHRPSSLSYAITTQLLEQELNFTGLKITDGLGMGALTKYYSPGIIELEAFLAGNDILLCPLDVPYAVELIEDAILSNRVSMEDLDQRVLKILYAKEWAGCHKFQPIDSEYACAQLTTAEGKALKELLDSEVAQNS